MTGREDSIQSATGKNAAKHKIIGIDSCKKGWTAFWQDSCGGYGYAVYRDIASLMVKHDDADYLFIDIPIGLPESEAEQALRPDRQLRQRLKGKGSSVFNVPCRQAVYECFDKQAAREQNIKILHKSLSEQSLGFAPKLKQVDEFLRAKPQYIGKLRESHPEYCFAVLNGGKPLLSKKSEDSGFLERKQLLEKYFPQAAEVLQKIRSSEGKQVLNDFVDAMALSVNGLIGLNNGFATIPERPHCDSKGLPMEIVYGKVNG